jgi:hypothetical protein
MSTKPDVNKLNELLVKAATNHKVKNQKIYYLETRHLEKELAKTELPIVTLEQELANDPSRFISENDVDLKAKFRGLIKSAEQVEDEKKNAVEQGDYEKAARLRDIQKHAEKEILNEIVQPHGFKQGFNWSNGKLIVIVEGELHKSQVLARII